MDLIVSSWFGVRGSSELGSDNWLTVRGQLLTIESTSHMSVGKDSSSSWEPLSSRRDDKTDLQSGLPFPDSAHMAGHQHVHLKGDRTAAFAACS